MADEVLSPSLEQLAAIDVAAGRELGSGYQAAVTLCTTPAGDVVVKTPHGGLLGGLWRYLLRREHAVYQQLAAVGGTPRVFGLLGGQRLVLEYIAGPSLREHEAQLTDRERFFAALLTTLRSMHAAGIVHADLKRKDNIIVGPGERPYLIDFGVACRRSDSSWLWNRWVFEPLKQMDYNAWVKLKYGRRVDPKAAVTTLSLADATLYRPLAIERIARAVRVAWQTITLRRPRQRWRARRRR